MSARSAGRFTTGLGEARARGALEAAGLGTAGRLERQSSVNNEVWLSGEHAIRVNPRPDRRLQREALLAGALPEEVGYPRVLGYGKETGFDWLIQERRPGTVLARSWPTMSEAVRRRATDELAAKLRVLHATPAPVDLPPLPDTPQLIVRGDHPAEKLLAALDRLRAVEAVGDRLVDALVGMVDRTKGYLGRFDETTLVHGDLGFENVLWDGQHVTALLDFEWARGAPPDVELDVLVRYCSYPFLHVAPDYEAATRADDYRDVLWWMRDSYPELFAHPFGIDRLRLYAIAFEVRQVLMDPPAVGARGLGPHHPVVRLRAIAAGTSNLDDLQRG